MLRCSGSLTCCFARARQKLTPELARSASDMFKNMSPEEMDRMMEMASKMQPGLGASASVNRAARSGGVPASAGPAGPPDMAQAMEAMKDPATVKMMTEMMKNISPETLASMSSAAGMKISPEDVRASARGALSRRQLCWSDALLLRLGAQAARVAEQMQNMKPEHLEKLIAVGNALQGGLAHESREVVDEQLVDRVLEKVLVVVVEPVERGGVTLGDRVQEVEVQRTEVYAHVRLLHVRVSNSSS